MTVFSVSYRPRPVSSVALFLLSAAYAYPMTRLAVTNDRGLVLNGARLDMSSATILYYIVAMIFLTCCVVTAILTSRSLSRRGELVIDECQISVPTALLARMQHMRLSEIKKVTHIRRRPLGFTLTESLVLHSKTMNLDILRTHLPSRQAFATVKAALLERIANPDRPL